MEYLDAYPGPGPSSAANQVTCQFFRRGSCRFGKTCKFLHSTYPEEDVPTPQVLPVPAELSEKMTSGAPAVSQFAFKIDPLKWVNAPEFVPKSKQMPTAVSEESNDLEDLQMEAADEEDDSDEGAVRDPADVEEPTDDVVDEGGAGSQVMSYAAIVTMQNNHNGLGIIEEQVDSVLCPYYEHSGECMLAECPYEHGEHCELCDRFCLKPADKEQQRQHNVECIKQHELDMEHSFAVQRSKDKICGICLEVILEKPGREQRFGILPNCSHVFCLECIRTWRKAKNFENKIKRGCPTCRISSDFVCPSIVWVEGRDEKDKLINDYKKACNTTHCKHFNQGSGKCPFGNKCFYKHALPCGQLVDVGGPSRSSENRLRMSHLQDFFREVLNQRGRLLDDFVSSFFSDSEESELSELYDYYDI